MRTVTGALPPGGRAFPVSAILAAAIAAFAADAPAPGAEVSARYEKGRDVRDIEAARDREREESLARMRDQAASEARARSALRLQEDPDGCVAYDPVVGECVVTVEAFNSLAEGWSPGQGGIRAGAVPPPSADSVRRTLLSELLAAEFPRVQALRLGLGDTVAQRLRGVQQERLARLGKGFGDSALHALYRVHGDRFRARREKIYLALGSSDSLLADSIRRSGEIRALTEPSGRARFRWQTLTEAELPPEAAAAKALRAGEAATLVRVPYGFLLVAAAGIRNVPAVPYAQALPALLAMAADPSAGCPGCSDGPGGPDERALREYHRTHRERFLSPDTARLKVWLVPALRTGRLSGLPAAPGGHGNWDDTLAARAAETVPFRLPPEVRRALGFSRAAAGRRLGPLRSPLGTWYFQVLDVRPGGRLLAYAEARPEVRRALFGGRDTASLGSLWVARKRGEWEKQQASAVLEELFRPDPEAVERAVRSGAADGLAGELPLDMSAAEKAEQAGLAFRQKETARLCEERFQAWMRRDLQLAFIDLGE